MPQLRRVEYTAESLEYWGRNVSVCGRGSGASRSTFFIGGSRHLPVREDVWQRERSLLLLISCCRCLSHRHVLLWGCMVSSQPGFGVHHERELRKDIDVAEECTLRRLSWTPPPGRFAQRVSRVEL